jgi:hypothetical protein
VSEPNKDHTPELLRIYRLVADSARLRRGLTLTREEVDLLHRSLQVTGFAVTLPATPTDEERAVKNAIEDAYEAYTSPCGRRGGHP